jgi:hypothetical protein
LKFVRDGSTPLPSLPWNVHGTVVHRLIASPPPDADFERAYDGALRQALERASGAQSRDPWLASFSRQDASGRPLLDLPNFAVRRAEGIALARRFAGQTVHPPGNTTAAHQLHETQISVGTLGASVDLLSEAGGLLVVTDFKTGAIHDPESPDRAVKPQYRAQLLIYAAMIHAMQGRWPDKIRLVSSDGTTHEESVDRDAAKALLGQCIRLRDETTALLTEGKLHQLARGIANGACGTCARRHRCPAIDNSLESDYFMKHGSGPGARFDLRGRVVKVENARGRSWLDIDVGASSAPFPRVLNLFRAKPKELIESLAPGSAVRIFGLRGNDRENGQAQTELPRSFDALETSFIDVMLCS